MERLIEIHIHAPYIADYRARAAEFRETVA